VANKPLRGPAGRFATPPRFTTMQGGGGERRLGHFEDSKSGTTPSWLKSFAARKKPKLEEPAVAAPGVDESAATCYMAEELLQCMEGYSNGGSAHRSDFVGLDSATCQVRCRR
jgi:hypothetical protein